MPHGTKSQLPRNAASPSLHCLNPSPGPSPYPLRARSQVTTQRQLSVEFAGLGGKDPLNKASCAVCLLVSSTLAVCQQPALSDNFVGTWQLNANKSSRSGVERESIQIDFQGGQYKFVCDRLGENGTELNWWFQTDMKGECVILTGVDGKPMSGTSCVTRLSPRKFVNDTKIIHEEYQ